MLRLYNATYGRVSDLNPKNLSSIVRGIKIGTSVYACRNNIPFAWQARFHDRIIRDQEEMNRIAEYIENNVARWEYDGMNRGTP